MTNNCLLNQYILTRKFNKVNKKIKKSLKKIDFLIRLCYNVSNLGQFIIFWGTLQKFS